MPLPHLIIRPPVSQPRKLVLLGIRVVKVVPDGGAHGLDAVLR